MAASTTSSIQRSNEDIAVEYGAAHTLAELQDAMADDSNFTVIPESLVDRIAYREIDVQTNTLVVALDRDAASAITSSLASPSDLGVETLSLADAQQVLEDRLETKSGMPFSVVLGETTEPTSVYGGENVDGCTSGFAVKSGSTRGMLTAGHCGALGKHYRSRTTSKSGSSYTAYDKKEVWGDDGDSQWYYTTQWESDNFYTTTSSTRDVTGYASRSNMYGDYVCHFGIASKYSCGTVTKTNYDPSYDVCGWFGCDNRWVKVEGSNLEACHGDSGGPWFNGRTAYGIQSGTNSSGASDCSASGTSHASFTAMNDVLNVLNVSLATS